MEYLKKLLGSKVATYSTPSAVNVTAAATADGATPVGINTVNTITSTNPSYYVALPEAPAVGCRVILNAHSTAANNFAYLLEAGNDNAARLANYINGVSGNTYYVAVPPNAIVIAEVTSTGYWQVTIAKKTGDSAAEAITATDTGATTGSITYGEVCTVTSAGAAKIVALPAATVGRICHINVATNGCHVVPRLTSTDKIRTSTGVDVTMAANSAARFICIIAGSWQFSYDAATLA